MNLRTYLKATGQTAADFARKAGLSPFTVGKWVRGERVPRPAQMRLIVEATGGAVTANDFMAANPPAAFAPAADSGEVAA